MMAYQANKITGWSFSRYNTYRQCPQLAKYKFIDKLAEPSSPALERGTEIHKLAEDYIKGKIRNIPKELKLFDSIFKFLKGEFKKKIAVIMVEDQWIFKSDYTMTVWNDWAGAWLRVKLDVAHNEDKNETMVVTDWKTGKYRPDEMEAYIMQLELYALTALIKYPYLKKVRPRLVYLDTGDTYPPAGEVIEYTQADVPKLKKLWEKRVKPMLNDVRFKPTPSDKCRWCFFSKEKNGPCKF
jgi:CRISPR/Cas system-associated exonuclease Cas4 (RecB family)